MKIMLFTISLFLCCSGMYAQQSKAPMVGDWQKLTITTVNFEQNEKEFLVAGKDRYSSIYFKVLTSQVDIKSLEILFDNGESQKIAVNEKVTLNANSAIIDLSGESRSFKRIILKYGQVAGGNEREARMELWANRTTR